MTLCRSSLGWNGNSSLFRVEAFLNMLGFHISVNLVTESKLHIGLRLRIEIDGRGGVVHGAWDTPGLDGLAARL